LVIDAGGEEVVGLLDGGEIAVKMEVDVGVRADARAAAAGGAALEAEDRAEGRLAEDGGGAFAEAREGVAETDSGGGLALAGGRGRDGRDEDEREFSARAASMRARGSLALKRPWSSSSSGVRPSLAAISVMGRRVVFSKAEMASRADIAEGYSR
jgi:hypothetical protein